MVIYHGRFHVIPGKTDEYLEEIRKSGLVEAFRKQPGNHFYSVGKEVIDDDIIIVCDCWDDRNTFQGHVDSNEVKQWHEIYHRYVVSCEEKEYEAEFL